MRAAPGCGGGISVEVALEVADDAVHLEAGVLLGQRLGGVADHAARRRRTARSAYAGPGVEQHARLRRRCPAPSSTSSAAPGARRDLVGARLAGSPARCGSGSTRAARDAVEQLGAAGVVEVLGRQLLERPREAVEHVVGERAARPRGGLVTRPMPAAARRRSAAAGGGPSCGTSASATRAARRPRAAAQDAVALAEEDLGVLAVGVGARSRGSRRTRVAVHSHVSPSMPSAPPAGAVRQRPAGAGRGRLVEVRGARAAPTPRRCPGPRSPPSPTRPRSGAGRRGRWRRRRPRTRRRGPRARRGAAARRRRCAAAAIRRAGGPALRVGDVVLLLPRPGLVGPPLAALVAAALDEGRKVALVIGGAADAEGADVARVARALVVVGEARRPARRS